MFNNNFIFPKNINILPGCYCRNYEPHNCTNFERENPAELEEQERNRRYQAALEEQAYLEALERKRKIRLVEERRRKQYQHLLEIERRRQEQEQEEKRRRQYLAHLERKRQEKLRDLRIRNKKAVALDALKRKEEMRRIFHSVNQINPLYRIIEGPDGNIYRVLFDPTDSMSRNYGNKQSSEEVETDQDDDQPSAFHVKSSHGNNDHFTKMDCSDDIGVSPPVQQVKAKDWLNIDESNKYIKHESKKKNIIPRKYLKSSILVGDVENASDSECEDEYNDYMHTRRPQAGQWIEPIECIANPQTFKKGK